MKITRQPAMFISRFSFCHYMMLAMLVLASNSTQASTATEPQSFPLDQVIAVTQAALSDYQSQAATSVGKPGSLPSLVSADFDFKTVTQTTVGGGINFLIFTIGATKQNQVTNDVEFLYMPEPTKEFHAASAPTPTLYAQLLSTLKAAAVAVSNRPSAPPQGTGIAPLDFCQLTVTIAFGVQSDIKGGVSVPELVTASLNADINKNALQQVKLTFKDADQVACKAKS